MIKSKYIVHSKDGTRKTIERTISKKEYLIALDVVKAYRKQNIKILESKL
jgi:hypothetical protein